MGRVHLSLHFWRHGSTGLTTAGGESGGAQCHGFSHEKAGQICYCGGSGPVSCDSPTWAEVVIAAADQDQSRDRVLRAPSLR